MCVDLVKSQAASKERLKVAELEAVASKMTRKKESALCARNVLCVKDTRVRSKSLTRVPSGSLTGAALKGLEVESTGEKEVFLTSHERMVKMRTIKAENASRVEAWVHDCSPENTDDPRVVTRRGKYRARAGGAGPEGRVGLGSPDRQWP